MGSRFPFKGVCIAVAAATLSTSCTKLNLAASADPIIEEWILDDWGYRSLGTDLIHQTDFDRDLFGNATIRAQSIKAANELADMPGFFCSFIVCEEAYPTVSDAAYRMQNLDAHPPGLTSKKNPEFTLREGFQVENRIIYASTHATVFHDVCMPGLIENLKTNYGISNHENK